MILFLFFGAELVQSLAPLAHDRGVLMTLSGDLGAGKTTLTQHIGRILGISGHITSPTFVIMKRYTCDPASGFDTLIHIDAYRLSSWQELESLDIATYMAQPRTLVIIEWPEHISDTMPQPDVTLTISLCDEFQRSADMVYYFV
ncbi:MAG: tRNA (adenosine(37)-N6)-threonylcarbamoyltransferase complex ATPase subunit type 1 TsaE [Candidatus Pacebacteria bacterium]|nr:tRNA (adenosine(37)-N6)-threonylcarbamoyltransferase complex ATPase subunit type 1 TsaE [Candidatus Paceibacterota bacterium]